MISEIYPLIKNLDHNELTTLNEIVFNDIISKQWLEPGKIFEERGNYPSAKVCYKIALLFDPFNLDIYDKLISIQLKDEQYEEVIKIIANLRIYNNTNWIDFVSNYFKISEFLPKFKLYLETKLHQNSPTCKILKFHTEILGILNSF